MAQEPGKDRPFHEIRQRIAHSRDQLGRDLSGLRYELDIPLKIRKSFQRKTALWIAAAVVIGLMFTVRSKGRRKVYVKAKKGKNAEESILETGLLLGAMKLAGSILKPVLITYAIQKMNAFSSRSKRKW